MTGRVTRVAPQRGDRERWGVAAAGRQRASARVDHRVRVGHGNPQGLSGGARHHRRRHRGRHRCRRRNGRPGASDALPGSEAEPLLEPMLEPMPEGTATTTGATTTGATTGPASEAPVSVARVQNLCPADAVLNLPSGRHSAGLARLAAVEAARGSFADARAAIERASGVRLGNGRSKAWPARPRSGVPELRPAEDPRPARPPSEHGSGASRPRRARAEPRPESTARSPTLEDAAASPTRQGCDAGGRASPPRSMPFARCDGPGGRLPVPDRPPASAHTPSPGAQVQDGPVDVRQRPEQGACQLTANLYPANVVGLTVGAAMFSTQCVSHCSTVQRCPGLRSLPSS